MTAAPGHPPLRAALALVVAVVVAAVLTWPAGVPASADGERVSRLAGPNRFATAAAIAADEWALAAEVVLADGFDPAASLVAAHLAARRQVPLLLATSTTIPRETAAALDRLRVETVTAIGEVAGPAGVDVERITAPHPITLAAAVARLAEGERAAPGAAAGRSRAVLAATLPDALAAANLAPTRLLLTDGDALSPDAERVIAELALEEVVLVGGEAVLSPAVAEQVSSLGPTTRRVAGGDRIGTALQAATATGGPAVLAAADTFADAVSVVPWAARRGAAVLLTGHDEVPSSVEIRLRGVEHSDVVIVGGTAAVGNFVDRQAAAALERGPAPGFTGGPRALTQAEVEAMTGRTWREGCPVSPADLRAIDASHWTMDGNVVDDGLLVVHRDVADAVTGVLAIAFDTRFPFERIGPARSHDGDDQALMAANVTSAFNCRTVAGTTRWSHHAYGTAIDINPVQNPYVRGDDVQPPAGTDFLDRSTVRPGMLREGDPVVEAFDALGWGWGGRWQSAQDYQHFSRSGR